MDHTRPMKILKTERLFLEELDEGHFEDLCALLSNPRVHRYFPGTLDREESREFLQRVRKGYREKGYHFWAVIRKKDRAFLGICGILDQIIDGKDELEVGYRILDSHWGQGYGTEAARGCVEYARDMLKAGRVIPLIREINTQSIRVAEKNGLQYEKDTMFNGMKHRVYRKILK